MSPATPIPDGSVIITPTEVYREVMATHQAVQTLTTTVNGMASDLTRRMGEIDGPNGKLQDHEARMRTVERQAAETADHEKRIGVLEVAVAPIADHKTRVPALEKKVWAASGVAAFVAAGATLGVTLWTTGH